MPDPADHLPTYQRAVAHALSCGPEDLLGFRWSPEDQQFIVLSPSGQKFRYDPDQVAMMIAADCPPAPTAAVADDAGAAVRADPRVGPAVETRHVASPPKKATHARKPRQHRSPRPPVP